MVTADDAAMKSLKEGLPPLWIDRYRPKTFKKMKLHKNICDLLAQLVACDDFPHLLVYGPSGAGKKTLVHCLLKALYGNGVDTVRIDNHDYETASKKKFNITTLSSNYHIEVCPSLVGFNRDKIVVQELVKQTAQTQQLDSAQQKSFKTIVIREADQLSQDAQNALRRTMEKYMATCKLVLICDNSTRVMPAIRSRCCLVRVPAPTVTEISALLESVVQKEGASVAAGLVDRIATNCERNVRVALMMAQAVAQRGSAASAEGAPLEADWRTFVRLLAQQVLKAQTPDSLKLCREHLYQLLAHCIAPATIFRCLAADLAARCDPSLVPSVFQLAAFYEHRAVLGRKAVFHLEAFLAAVMQLLKAFADRLVGDFHLDDDMDFEQ